MAVIAAIRCKRPAVTSEPPAMCRPRSTSCGRHGHRDRHVACIRRLETSCADQERRYVHRGTAVQKQAHRHVSGATRRQREREKAITASRTSLAAASTPASPKAIEGTRHDIHTIHGHRHARRRADHLTVRRCGRTVLAQPLASVMFNTSARRRPASRRRSSATGSSLST